MSHIFTTFASIPEDAVTDDSDTESCHLEDIREKFGIIEEHVNTSRSTWGRLKARGWKILDEPTSSTCAKVLTCISILSGVNVYLVILTSDVL